MDAFEFGAQF